MRLAERNAVTAGHRLNQYAVDKNIRPQAFLRLEGEYFTTLFFTFGYCGSIGRGGDCRLK